MLAIRLWVGMELDRILNFWNSIEFSRDADNKLLKIYHLILSWKVELFLFALDCLQLT